ncbi:hypothetical protein GCM10023160_02140 [Brachybacterium paraconglomeratum]|uniref:hypothetical protein n=1 Tax=Brachybacterium paraconglomeratum TaxID=173362 RepID=UPI0031E61D66
MSSDFTRYAGALDHRSAWLSRGVHTRELASDLFTAVFPGYLTLTSAPASLNVMAWVLQNRVRPGSVLSHTTAALLWGIPLPAGLESGIGLLHRPGLSMRNGVAVLPSVRPGSVLGVDAALPVLHCRVPSAGSGRIGRGAIMHRTRPGATSRLGTLVVSSPADTLRELATLLPRWDVVAAIESVIGPDAKIPGATVETLGAAFEAASGTAGTARARTALGLARTGVKSPGESVMRLVLESAGFPAPVPNLPVRDPVTGQARYIDLAWESVGIGLEYDGDDHRTTKEQWRDDENRRDELSALGWTLARANGDDLWNPGRILRRLRRSLGERGLPVPSEERIGRTLSTLAVKRRSLRIAPRPR